MPDRAYPPTTILGVDPGPTPGAVRLVVVDGVVEACPTIPDADTEALVSEMAHVDWIAVERFVVSGATMKRTRAASMTTIAQAEALATEGARRGLPVQFLPAGTVKPWCTDLRLRAAGIAVVGDHHRDAARHALFMATRHGLVVPPMGGKIT